jgi:hypothetical protein
MMGTPAVSVWTPGLRRTGLLALLFALIAPGVAGAAAGGRDDCAPCTRHARAEYEAAHVRSKQFEHLDCASLTAYTEGQRQCYNRQALSIYLGSSGAQAPATAPARATVPAAPRENATTPEPKPSSPEPASPPAPAPAR